MSTVKKNTARARFAQIARMGEIILHTDDFANLWGILDKNTLYTTLKRYTQEGLIYRVYRGLYSIKPIDQIDPFLLGVRAMHKYAYISTETVLINEGLILQVMPFITLISSQSKHYTIGSNQYRCRQLADKFLYNDAGIKIKNGIPVAGVARAVADVLYFHPRYYIDGHKQIDWKSVNDIQKQLGYKIIKYDDYSSKTRRAS